VELWDKFGVLKPKCAFVCPKCNRIVWHIPERPHGVRPKSLSRDRRSEAPVCKQCGVHATWRELE
jgi:hypothetical protein